MLQNNQLLGPIPTEIGALHGLTELNFEGNQLTASCGCAVGCVYSGSVVEVICATFSLSITNG